MEWRCLCWVAAVRICFTSWANPPLWGLGGVPEIPKCSRNSGKSRKSPFSYKGRTLFGIWRYFGNISMFLEQIGDGAQGKVVIYFTISTCAPTTAGRAIPHSK